MKHINTLKIIKIIAAYACITTACAVFAHISLETKQAAPGSTYKAVLQVGHGCNGAATTAIAVQIPPGFQGAKPYPKAGWTVTLQRALLAVPYDNHGKQVTEDVSHITWTASNKEAALPDAFFDDFMLRGKLPDTAGPLWFKVLQTCEAGSNAWVEVPANGTSTQGLKAPAALLNVQLPDNAAQPKPAEHKH